MQVGQTFQAGDVVGEVLQTVFRQVETRQVAQLPDFGREVLQLVVVEPELLQRRQLPDVRRLKTNPQTNPTNTEFHTSSSISLSPKSSLSRRVRSDSDVGSSLSKFSLNSKEVNAVSMPKSAGRDVKDMSFKPRTVRDLSWLNAGGSRGMGLELKSATWRARSAPMLSGMSGISTKKSLCGPQTHTHHSGRRPTPPNSRNSECRVVAD